MTNITQYISIRGNVTSAGSASTATAATTQRATTAGTSLSPRSASAAADPDKRYNSRTISRDQISLVDDCPEAEMVFFSIEMFL